MSDLKLSTSARITWCPGCPNSQILVAFRGAVTELVDAGELKKENIVAASGIGCHGKITDYLDMNTFTTLHGRVVAALEGIKLANNGLTAVGFEGDGDGYSEGIGHIVHAARRNSDVNLFIHDNMVFALTTGQATSTSPKGFKGKSTPQGSFEEPLDPLRFMLALGATFVARAYAGDIQKTKEVMKAAIRHKGFSFVDIIQPCITFFDTRDSMDEHVKWTGTPAADPITAMESSRIKDDVVPCGIFYQTERPTYEASL